MHPWLKKVGPHLVFVFVAVLIRLYPLAIQERRVRHGWMYPGLAMELYHLALGFFLFVTLASALYFKVKRGHWHFAKAYLVALGALLGIVLVFGSWVMGMGAIAALMLFFLLFSCVLPMQIKISERRKNQGPPAGQA